MMLQANEHNWERGEEPSEGGYPCGHLGFGLASGTVRQPTSVVLSHPVCGTLVQQTLQSNTDLRTV